ncbi:GNAT family protein [Anaerofustis butyriciformans]|uniref:GNAT family N-acetyltransferase n=1 Tax=Anaerofustis butyriciformans TaxID=3108533 RepID=UPI002E33B029|nr:GNAT family protein [Anaerofustis sp. HA2171]
MDFKLEKWDIKYLEDVVKHANNRHISNNLRDVFPYPYTKENAEFFIKDCINNDINNILKAITVNGKAVGSISVIKLNDVNRKTAEIGYWIGEEFQNKGIMKKAVKMVIKEAFERMDIVRIEAEIFETNIPSRKVLQNNGFKLEGRKEKSIFKNGKIMDSLMYSIVK